MELGQNGGYWNGDRRYSSVASHEIDTRLVNSLVRSLFAADEMVGYLRKE